MTREAPRFPEALLSIRLPSKPLGKKDPVSDRNDWRGNGRGENRLPPDGIDQDSFGFFNYSFRFSVWAAVWIGSQEPLKGGA